MVRAEAAVIRGLRGEARRSRAEQQDPAREDGGEGHEGREAAKRDEGRAAGGEETHGKDGQRGRKETEVSVADLSL